MTPPELLKAVSAVTGVAVYSIKKRQLHATLRSGSDARMLAVLAARSLWPRMARGHLGKCVGLSQGGSIAALNRGNARFRNDPAFASAARKLLALIDGTTLPPPHTPVPLH